MPDSSPPSSGPPRRKPAFEEEPEAPSNLPTRMPDWHLFGLLSVLSLFAGGMLYLFTSKSDRFDNTSVELSPMEVFCAVLISAGIVFGAFAYWKALHEQ
ncbi:MAG: hypothetical protein HY291_05745 [Planctomycetes bacterium]|nr:hypothetical protein [Planctomycetota bacterium]